MLMVLSIFMAVYAAYNFHYRGEMLQYVLCSPPSSSALRTDAHPSTAILSNGRYKAVCILFDVYFTEPLRMTSKLASKVRVSSTAHA